MTSVVKQTIISLKFIIKFKVTLAKVAMNFKARYGIIWLHAHGKNDYLPDVQSSQKIVLAE